MFRPQRRVLDTLLPFQPGIEIPDTNFKLREKEECRHAFVLAASNDSEHLYAARALVRSVSDAVRRPRSDLYVGSLAHTWAYFGSLDSLHRTLHKTMCEGFHEGVEGAVLRVVVASSRLRGFLFARFTQARGILYAMPFDLAYRRFVGGLSWEAWQEGVSAFLECLDMRRAVREDALQGLKRFVESLRQLRISRPGQFPPSLPLSDVERRFGGTVAALWREWVQGDEPLVEEKGSESAQGLMASPLPVWRVVPEERLAREAATRSDEVESTRDAFGLPLSQLGFLVRETVFACVAKIAAGAQWGCRLGLKDFRLEITFDNGPVLVRHIELAFPVYGRDAHAEAIVDRILENLPRGPAEIPAEVPAQISGDAPPASLAVFHLVNRVEGVSVVPTHVARKEEEHTDLFECGSWVAGGLAEVHERMRVKDKARPCVFVVSDNVTPLHEVREFCMQTEPQAIESVGGSSTVRPLFRYAQATRPLQILSSCPRFERGQAVGLSLRFLESVEGFDYFLGVGVAEHAYLWLRSPLEEREKEASKRELTLLGVFEEAVFRERPELRHVL